MKVKCIIIDDDKVFTQILEHYISKVDFLEFQRTYYSSEEAFNEMDSNSIDLIFLDMEMPEMHGLEFLNALTVKPVIVFVSRSNAYGPEAYENNAIDYLHKPITLSRFLKSSTKIKNHFEVQFKHLESKSDGIFIRYNGLWQKLTMNTICVIKADNNNVIITTEDNKYQTNIKLKEIIQKLPESEFMQIHRSYIVNLRKITKIDGEIIEINGRPIPVSKPYLNKLYNRLNLG